jgi:hypothetical protein
VLIVSAIAAALMLAGALILAGDADDDDGEDDLNVMAVMLDTAADAPAAAGMAASGAIILGAGGWYWLDPATALGMKFGGVLAAAGGLRLVFTVLAVLAAAVAAWAAVVVPAAAPQQPRPAEPSCSIFAIMATLQLWRLIIDRAPWESSHMTPTLLGACDAGVRFPSPVSGKT